MTTDPAFDDWLRDALGRRNVSGSTLARVLGLPLSTVAAWLGGAAVPAEDQLPPLAEALRISLREVLGHHRLVGSALR